MAVARIKGMALSEAEFEALRERMADNRKPSVVSLARGFQESANRLVTRAVEIAEAGAALKAKAPRKRGMNKWESEYAQELEVARQTGQILWWAYEPIRLRLADNTGYTPDFCELFPSGLLRFVEIKGFLRDDANVKFKMAAELYPFDFVMLRKQKAKDGAGWLCIKHLNNRKGLQ